MDTTAIPPIYVVNYNIDVIGEFTKIFHDELSAWHHYYDIIDDCQGHANFYLMKAGSNGAYYIDKVLAANDNN